LSPSKIPICSAFETSEGTNPSVTVLGWCGETESAALHSTLFECSSGTAPSILRGLADRKGDLVCCVGLSKGASTSENITLRTSIGRSVDLCIADSLKTTSELRTTW
jgi:hypothetical protein